MRRSLTESRAHHGFMPRYFRTTGQEHENWKQIDTQRHVLSWITRPVSESEFRYLNGQPIPFHEQRYLPYLASRFDMTPLGIVRCDAYSGVRPCVKFVGLHNATAAEVGHDCFRFRSPVLSASSCLVTIGGAHACRVACLHCIQWILPSNDLQTGPFV